MSKCLAWATAALLAAPAAWSATDADYERSLQAVIDDAANPEASLNFVEAAVAAGDLRGAAAALERILLIDPRLANIRLELGVLYLRMGNSALAQYHIDEALRAPNIPQTVRARAERLLARASSQARRSTFRLESSFGLRNDSNANAGPTSGEVFVMDPFTFQPTLVPIGAGGETSDSSAEIRLTGIHSYAFSGGSSWDTNLTGYLVRYADLGDLDQHSFGIDTGPTAVIGGTPDAPVSLRPSFAIGQAFLDSEDYYEYTSVGLTLNAFSSPSTLTQVRVSFEDRNFDNGALFLSDRSGDYVIGELRQLWQRGKWQFSLGLLTQNADLEADYQSSHGFGASAGVRYFGTLGVAQRPWSVYLGVDYLENDYDAADPSINTDIVRSDERMVFSAGIEVSITRSFALALDLSQLDNDSNLPNYEFDNFSVGVRALFRF